MGMWIRLAKWKPVVDVRTNFLASEDENLNAMLSQSSDTVCQKSLNEDIVELSKKIIERLERLGGVAS